jgi:LPXTG-motif cell wall-anchored protein
MNVRFPGWETSAGFWTIVGVMLAIAISLVGFFRYKRWL